MTHLGLMYEKGRGVAKDHGQAIYWYKRAAEQGYPKAKTYLARLHSEATQEPTAAIPAKQTIPLPSKTKTTLSDQTLSDSEANTEQSGNTYSKDLKQAAVQGDANAQLALAQSFLNTNSPPQ